MKWNDWLDRALVDLTPIAVSTTIGDKQALGHMRDAVGNLTQAIEALEEQLEGE